MVKRILIAASVASLGLSAAACNTVDGVGEDVESVAEEVDEEL